MSRKTSHGTATKIQLCAAFGVSRQAVDKAMRDKRPALAKPAAVGRYVSVEELKPAILQIATEHKAWGVRKVWATLRRRKLTASQKRVHAIMRSMNLTLPSHPRRGTATREHVAVPASNRRWGTDLTTAWTRLDGWVAVVPLLDYGDRFFLDFEVTKSQDAMPVLAPIERALEVQFGSRRNVPDGFELRTDHGPQYTGKDCEHLCWRWQVEHTYSPIGRPTGNSVAERFILTLKTELIWTQDWDSLHDLQAAIKAWRDVYNEQRPHQALQWQTPHERRNQQLYKPLALAS